MTERWQRELSKINSAEFGVDLWDRILEGPRLEPAPETVRSRPRTAALAFAVFVAASIFVWTTFRTVVPPPDALAGSNVVEVPPRGQTVAAFLEDGRPVFVAHHLDGTVTVLDAFSPRRDWGIRQLVSWCTTKPYFLTWPDGSFFGRSGPWIGGRPAPPGLGAYAFEIQTRDANGDAAVLRIRTLGPVLAHGHSNLSTRKSYASGCGLANGSSADVVAHVIDRSQIWDSPAAAVRAAPTGWIAVEGRLAVGGDRSVRMCSSADLNTCDESATVRGVDGQGLRRKLEAAPDSRYGQSHVWLALTDGRTIVDLAVTQDHGPA